MVVLREKVVLPVDRKTAFKFLSDFSNTARWDPGVKTSVKVSEGPVAVGTKYDLVTLFNGKPSNMTYECTKLVQDETFTVFGQTPSALTKVYTTDYVDFKDGANPNETEITYTADIRLRGVLFFAIPLVYLQLGKLGKEAMRGMKEAFERKEYEK